MSATSGEQTRSISIHALREEGDLALYELLKLLSNFYPRPPRGGRQFDDELEARLVKISIHALREEGDCCAQSVRTSATIFLSTPSARRATCGSFGTKVLSGFLSTPSARRATGQHRRRTAPKPISIHALREEGDRDFIGNKNIEF